MWTRRRDGEVEFNINFTMEDIRHWAEQVNVTNLSDDDCFDLASELENRFNDLLEGDELSDIIYDTLGDREGDE